MMTLLRRNILWFLLTAILGTFAWFAEKAVSLTAMLGTVFLLLTLLPENLRKLPIPGFQKTKALLGKLTLLRRDFGIVAGLLFVEHVLLVLRYFGYFTTVPLLTKTNFPGSIALIVMIILILTSNLWSMKLLKQYWKAVQSLVWFALPLIFAHGILAKWAAEQELSAISIIGYGGLALFVVLEIVAGVVTGQRSKTALRHAVLMFVGSLVAGGIVWWWR